MQLRDLVRDALAVEVWCNRCNRHGRLDTLALIARLGPDAAVPEVARRCRCSACGSRDVHTRPDWSPDSPGVITSHAPLAAG